MTNLDTQLAAINLAWSLPEGHSPSVGEQDTLAAFMGWGGLARAFEATPSGPWLNAADRLDEILPATAFQAAQQQVDTSYFTPATITDTLWQLLAATGFTGGRVLEPGCGSGSFMATAPAAFDIDWTGVEIDPTSARMARLRNPEAHIIDGALERTPLRDEWYDVAIGNVPFSSVTVGDSFGRHEKLHNYFTLRAIDAVRPGGYIILVTSRYAIDSLDGIRTKLRTWNGAALIGAVRLPSGAFDEAGTQTVTDILVIRKNDSTLQLPAFTGQPDTETVSDPYAHWRSSRTEDRRYEVTDHRPGAPEGATALVSRYWAEHPEHIAGRMLATGFDRAPLIVHSDDPATDIGNAVAALARALPQMTSPRCPDDVSDVVLADAEGRKEGSFHVLDHALCRVVDGRLDPVRTSKELIALVELRDLAKTLLSLEADPNLPDEVIDFPRQATRQAYETYVSRFGHLNRGTLTESRVDEETGVPSLSWRRPAMGGFRRDPDSAVVMALEVFDQDTGDACPAPILLHRVNRALVRVESADSPTEALAISLGESGRVDLERIAGLLGLASDEAAGAALGDLIYSLDDRLFPAAEALSGNVRHKLARAQQAADAGDPQAERTAAALKAVLPADLGPTEISIALGSPFVAVGDIREFVLEILGANYADVVHTPEQAVWEVNVGSFKPGAALEWGIPQMDPARILECALNNRMPEVTDREWRGDRQVQVRNPQASAAANTKLELIKDRFATWVWEDAERAERIARRYNDALNSHVARTYDGSGLTFPGITADFTPWPHQRAAVERIVSSERAMLAHPVGAGKTSEMIMGARTLRQFGLANKPMIVVPNHLLEQVSREAQQLFPTGRFLVATKDDLVRDARRLFAARCATGDWDAVIITHTAFGSIPLHAEVEREWIEEQKLSLQWAMQSSGNGRGAKAIARAVRAFEARVAKLREGKNDPDAIHFDQLGVDYLMVDEAHLFRRLDTGSTTRDNGMGSGSSKRSTDLLMKVETLAKRRPGAPIASFYTGTPWSNTLAETWVWQRFLQPEALDEMQLLQFDAWVSAFIRYESNIEVAPDGTGFRMYRRPVGVVNAPELKMLLSQVADVMDPASLGLARPEHQTVNITVPATARQKEFVNELARRADAIRSGGSPKRGEDADNMLLVCNDGRKIALDPRLAGIAEDSPKLVRAADEIAKAFHQGRDRTFGRLTAPGAFQLAFMDLGTPHPGDSQSYGRMRRMLIARGVPATMIRFVHEATTDKARAALFASCRDGDTAVLIASTAKAGMGTNIQTRLTHLWHIDAPWLPSEVIQRDGRAVRPGNLAGHVQLTRMVTEGTFDAYIWQALERKSRAFDALYSTGSTAREIEDVSSATMSYGEVKALASGNPLLLDQAKVRAEVKQLQVMRAMHLQGVNVARDSANQLSETAARSRRNADLLTDVAVTVTAPDDRAQTLTGVQRAVELRWQAAGSHDRYDGAYIAPIDYRGLRLSVHRPTRAFGGRTNEYRVEIAHQWNPIADVTLTPKAVRRGAKLVAGSILEQVDEVLDGAAARSSELIGYARRCDEQAAEHQSVVDSAVFARQVELEAAISRLAEIDTLIAADVREPALAA